MACRGGGLCLVDRDIVNEADVVQARDGVLRRQRWVYWDIGFVTERGTERRATIIILWALNDLRNFSSPDRPGA